MQQICTWLEYETGSKLFLMVIIYSWRAFSLQSKSIRNSGAPQDSVPGSLPAHPKSHPHPPLNYNLHTVYTGDSELLPSASSLLWAPDSFISLLTWRWVSLGQLEQNKYLSKLTFSSRLAAPLTPPFIWWVVPKSNSLFQAEMWVSSLNHDFTPQSFCLLDSLNIVSPTATALGPGSGHQIRSPESCSACLCYPTARQRGLYEVFHSINQFNQLKSLSSDKKPNPSTLLPTY